MSNKNTRKISHRRERRKARVNPDRPLKQKMGKMWTHGGTGSVSKSINPEHKDLTDKYKKLKIKKLASGDLTDLKVKYIIDNNLRIWPQTQSEIDAFLEKLELDDQ